MSKEKIVTSKTTGLDSNIAAALSYSLGLVSGVFFLVIERDDEFVKFHAFQSILANIVLIILPAILFFTIIGIILIPFVWLFALIMWVILIVKAYHGEKYKLPFIGNFAERQKL